PKCRSPPLPTRLFTSALSPSSAAASNWPERLDTRPGTAAGGVAGAEPAPPGCGTTTAVPGCSCPAALSRGAVATGEAGPAVGLFEALAGVDADGFSSKATISE